MDDSKKNLENYLKNDLQISEVDVLGKISTMKGLEITQNLISQKDNFIAFGNIKDPESVKIGKMENLHSGEELSIAQTGLKDVVTQEIKIDTNILEITWNNKGQEFTTLCLYNNSGIIWDNILGGLVMIDARGNTEARQKFHLNVTSNGGQQTGFGILKEEK